MAEGSVVQPVAAADVPKPFFVTAITPAGDGTTDDNPVSAIAPTGTAAGASNIPASVFLGLGSRPLSAVPVPGRGAVLSPPDAFERVFTQAPFVPLPDQFLRLSILTQFLDYVGGDDRESQAAPESSSRGTVPEWGATWLWGPGGLLGAAGTQPATRSHLPERVPGEALSEPDNSDEDPEPVSRPDPVAWFRPQTTPLGEHSVSTGVLAGTCETPTQTTESGRAGLLAWAFLGVAWGGRKPSERGVGQPGRRWWDERVG